jgi:imidazole glycerol-phosphate synthase
VLAAEAYWASGRLLTGLTAIEEIARVYGCQAVVVSVDPKCVLLRTAEEEEAARRAGHHILASTQGRACWYQCTIKGGREVRPLCAVQLAIACEALGAGELLVNCVDQDGQKQGFDITLLSAISSAVHIPVIASSGAGCVEHFSQVFAATRVEAALAAGIFHRNEVLISEVKQHLLDQAIPARVLDV